MAKASVDPFRPAPSLLKNAVQGWMEVKTEDLGELDVDVSIEVTSLSPVAEDAQRAAWNVVLQLVSGPSAVFLFMPNPEAPQDPSPMLRKTLMLNGIKSDTEIREIWRIGQAVMAAQAASESAKLKASTKSDLPHSTFSFKGPDLADPLIRQAFIQAEGLREVENAQPPTVPVGGTAPANGNGSGGGAPQLHPPGTATGVPATGPAGAS